MGRVITSTSQLKAASTTSSAPTQSAPPVRTLVKDIFTEDDLILLESTNDGRKKVSLSAKAHETLDTTSDTSLVTGPLVIDGHRRLTYAGPLAAILARAASGHRDRATLDIDFPAGSATSLRLSPAFNITSADYAINPSTDPSAPNLVSNWDSAVPNVLALTQVGALTFGTLLKGRADDVVAPTIVSARVDSLNPDALVVTTSKPVCWHSVVTGLSLAFTSGTPRTITAIESGDGTASTTFTLSGNISQSDAFKLVVDASRVATDYSGNALATNGAGTSAQLLFGLSTRAAWTRCFEKGVGMLPASGLPAPLTSWTDQVGGSLQIQQTAGGGSASRTTAGLQFTNDATERCKATMALTSGTDFAFYVRAQFTAPGTHDWVPISFDRDGAGTFPFVFLRLIDNGTDTTAIVTLNDGVTNIDLANWTYASDTAPHDYFFWRIGTALHFQVDDLIAPANTNSANVTGATTLGVGSGLVPTAFKPGAGTVIHIGTKSGAGFVGTEIADTRAYTVGT